MILGFNFVTVTLHHITSYTDLFIDQTNLEWASAATDSHFCAYLNFLVGEQASCLSSSVINNGLVFHHGQKLLLLVADTSGRFGPTSCKLLLERRQLLVLLRRECTSNVKNSGKTRIWKRMIVWSSIMASLSVPFVQCA